MTRTRPKEKGRKKPPKVRSYVRPSRVHIPKPKRKRKYPHKETDLDVEVEEESETGREGTSIDLGDNSGGLGSNR